MSLFVYAPTIYPGTRELLDALQAKRLVKHDGMRFLHKGVPISFDSKDAIVCWGKQVPQVNGVRCLNASYVYPDALTINSKGLHMLYNHGAQVFLPSRIGSDAYNKYMAKMKPDVWWPANWPHGYVPIPEIEGYGNERFKFTATNKVFVFKGNPLGSVKVPTAILGALDLLKLDFGMAYLGEHKTATYILRFIPAPSLNAEEVTLVAEQINKWYAGG